ncbi:MAG: hypothetical protein Kow009_07550 [Spirochaetales bacterium]
MKRLNKADIVSGIGLCILSVVVFMGADVYRGQGTSAYGPHLFPQFLSVLLFVLSVILLVAAVRGRSLQPRDTIDRRGMIRAGGAILVSVVYLVIMQLLGFLLSTILFLFTMMTYLKQRSILIRILVSVGVAFFFMFLFENFLKIPLPTMDFTFSY